MLAASSVSGATVNASSAYTTSATGLPARASSRRASFARTCNRRDGGRSGVVIRLERSSTNTSGRCVCHSG